MIQERRSNAQIAQLEIYTDGSCKKLGTNATFGGWSFIALRAENEFMKSPEANMGPQTSVWNYWRYAMPWSSRRKTGTPMKM